MTEMREALAGLVEAATAEFNEKGAGGFALARLSDARRALSARDERAVERGWILTTDRLPEKPGRRSYEHVECLIFYKGKVLMRPWNCEHLCWDDSDGDDWFCDPTAPTHWQPLPAPPAIRPGGNDGPR